MAKYKGVAHVKYHDLLYINADKFSHIAMPTWDNNISLDSPATSAMIDFRLRPMSDVAPNVPVELLQSEKTFLSLVKILNRHAQS